MLSASIPDREAAASVGRGAPACSELPGQAAVGLRSGTPHAPSSSPVPTTGCAWPAPLGLEGRHLSGGSSRGNKGDGTGTRGAWQWGRGLEGASTAGKQPRPCCLEVVGSLLALCFLC